MRHLVIDGGSPPLEMRLSPASRHDYVMLSFTLDTGLGVRHGRGRLPNRPDKLRADQGYADR